MANQTSVVIVNWNGAEFLRPLLLSIEKCKPHEIIVIDNASEDNSADILAQFPSARIIRNTENLGFARAANQGIRQCKMPYVLLLNADVEVLPGAITRLQKFLQDVPSAAVVAPQLLFPNGTIQPSCRTFPTIPKMFFYLSYLDHIVPTGYRLNKELHEETMEVDQPMGAAFMMRKASLEEVGNFDEDFFLYMEEVDLCQRLKQARYKIFYLPEAKMIHYAGGSSRKDWERSQRDFLQSTVLYFRKRTSSKFRQILLKVSLSFALLLRSVFSFLRGGLHRSSFYAKSSLWVLGR
jgi:GT2 family glycosyltransferase